MASARKIGDQVYSHWLKHMAWRLQGLKQTIYHLSHHFGDLAHQIYPTVLLVISLNTMPVVTLAEITQYMIWTKAAWQWHIMELNQQLLMQSKILNDSNDVLYTLLPAH